MLKIKVKKIGFSEKNKKLVLVKKEIIQNFIKRL